MCGHVRQQRAHPGAAGRVGPSRNAIYAGADAAASAAPKQRRSPPPAAVQCVKPLTSASILSRRRSGPAVGIAQGANVGKTFTHAVEVGHMAGRPRLHKSPAAGARGCVQRFPHAVKTAGHLQFRHCCRRNGRKKRSLPAFGRLATA